MKVVPHDSRARLHITESEKDDGKIFKSSSNKYGPTIQCTIIADICGFEFFQREKLSGQKLMY